MTRARSVSRTTRDASWRLLRHCRCPRRSSCGRRGCHRPDGVSRNRHARRDLAGDRPGEEANSTWLIGRTLDRDLKRGWGGLSPGQRRQLLRAVGGQRRRRSRAPVVFGVIVGTGCGGGVVVHGQVLTGPHAIAGEWGHNPLPWPASDELPGPECYCGKRGCLETYLSGPGLARDYAAGATRSAEIKGATVVERAGKGDRHASAALDRYAHRLASGLATVINTLDPDVIVLGGGVSTSRCCTMPSRAGWISSSSPIGSRHGLSRRCMGTRAASAARHGCGHAAIRGICLDLRRGLSADDADVRPSRFGGHGLTNHMAASSAASNAEGLR